MAAVTKVRCDRFMLKVLMPILLSALPAAWAFGAHSGIRSNEGVANEVPKKVESVGIEPRLGKKLDLDLKFRDQDGREVTLGDYTKDGKPILLSLAYFSCPSLCNYHLNGLNDAFKQLPKPLGDEFNVLVVSFDPKEKPELAKAKRENYLKEYGRPAGAKGWHFLTGESDAIAALTKAVGFSYRWVEEDNQYAHASAAYAIAPDGTISRYLFGISFDPKTLRLSMLEASNGKVGSVVDKLILYCFHWDENNGKFTLAAMNIMRLGGILVVVVIGLFLVPFWFRARKGDVR